MASGLSWAQEESLDGREGRNLALGNFRPRPTLKVRQTLLEQALFPVVDVHTHFRHRLKHDLGKLDEYVQLMDKHNIAVCCSLDGKLGNTLDTHLEYLGTKYPDRFVVFANVDWQGGGDENDPSTWACHQSGFGEKTARQLQLAVGHGVSGLKLFKQFGLSYKNPDGSLIKIDDPRWSPIWKACGQLGIPVIMHTADPIAFFRPIDETNERWEELFRHPEWSFPPDKYPTRESLLAARNRVIERHPDTNFIGAHLANSSEDLVTVASWLEKYPNLYVEFASRIGELGRQPYTARRFFLKYTDRILFGTDGPWPELRLTYYWRFLETYDEYFPYSEKEFPPQGFWRIYGIGLPPRALRQIYYENACRIIPGVKSKVSNYRR
ncbi:MAG: amidohydrolase family protein [Planctomycetota bacterium]|nr:amidohydrolase family protein [Planctomycetota bacterium]